MDGGATAMERDELSDDGSERDDDLGGRGRDGRMYTDPVLFNPITDLQPSLGLIIFIEIVNLCY